LGPEISLLAPGSPDLCYIKLQSYFCYTCAFPFTLMPAIQLQPIDNLAVMYHGAVNVTERLAKYSSL